MMEDSTCEGCVEAIKFLKSKNRTTDTIIFAMVTGSQAYNLSNDNSDTDFFGVCVTCSCVHMCVCVSCLARMRDIYASVRVRVRACWCMLCGGACMFERLAYAY